MVMLLNFLTIGTNKNLMLKETILKVYQTKQVKQV